MIKWNRGQLDLHITMSCTMKLGSQQMTFRSLCIPYLMCKLLSSPFFIYNYLTNHLNVDDVGVFTVTSVVRLPFLLVSYIQISGLVIELIKK